MFKVMNSFHVFLSEAPYGNIYEEAYNGGGFDNAAMHQHVESYHQIPTAARFPTFLAHFLFFLLLVDVTLCFEFFLVNWFFNIYFFPPHFCSSNVLDVPLPSYPQQMLNIPSGNSLIYPYFGISLILHELYIKLMDSFLYISFRIMLLECRSSYRAAGMLSFLFINFFCTNVIKKKKELFQSKGTVFPYFFHEKKKITFIFFVYSGIWSVQWGATASAPVTCGMLLSIFIPTKVLNVFPYNNNLTEKGKEKKSWSKSHNFWIDSWGKKMLIWILLVQLFISYC